MKLVRYGAPGREKPGIIDADGKIRDLSRIVPDIDGAMLAAGGLAKIKKANLKRLKTVAPLGPWFVSKDEIKDPQNLAVWSKVNGEKRQNGNTRNMIFDCQHVVWYCSQFFVLEPGDVIATGTPAGVPVAITSPGSSTKNCEQYQTICWQSKIMLRVLPFWRFSPLTFDHMARFCGSLISSLLTNQGPSGPKVSAPLPLAKVCPCSSWNARSDTSLPRQ